ncbi:MAG: XRE family transcriptional regulator [Bryobacterales bacterium]|nr:XRE family transcriptional regulator [Bryobacterales bacterium]
MVANKLFETSTGNVFADLQLADAGDLLVKAELTSKILAEIKRRRLTQLQTAEILRVDQPKVSNLQQGKLRPFSIERLLRFLLLLGQDVDIVVKAKARSRAGAKLRVA